MIYTRLTTLAAAALLLGAVACGGDDATSPPPAPPTATSRLLNDTRATIVAVYFTSGDESTWGSNRLAASESIAPGALRSWTVQPGSYDFRASTGSKTASWYDRELAPGGALQLAVPTAVNAMIATGVTEVGITVAR